MMRRTDIRDVEIYRHECKQMKHSLVVAVDQ